MTFSFAPISLGHTKPQDELDEALVGGQKKLDQDKDGDIDAKDFAMLRGKKKKKKNDDDPEGQNGDTATMSPKVGDVKEYGMVYSNKNKKGKITPPYPASEGHMDKKKHPSYYENKKKEVSEISFRPDDETSLGKRYADKVMRGDYSSKKTDNRKKGIATMVYKRAAQKGVPGVAKVPFKDHVEKDGNMSIREKLISVVERASHGNMDSQETYDDMYKGAGAKKMRKDHQNMKVDTTRKLGVDDASKAGKAIKKAPMRNADNPKGDINIVPPGTPMKDPAASKDTALENVMAAYKSMNEVSQELAFKAADKAETNRKKSKGPFDRSPNYAKRDRQATKFTQAGMYRQYKDGKLTTGEGGLKIGKRKKTDENVMAAESMHQEGSIKGSGTDRKAELKRAFRSGEHQTDMFYGDRGRTPKRAIKVPKGMRDRGQYTSKHSDKSIERAFNTGKHADQSLVPPKGKERQKPQDELKGAKSRRDVELKMRRGQPVDYYAVKRGQD